MGGVSKRKPVSAQHSYKILVVTSCTKDKVLPAQLSNHSLVGASQLWDDREDDRTQRHFGELEPYRVPAAQLYHGLQHTELMCGVDLLRRTFGQATVSVKIISAGFGVVDEGQMLPLYDATFAGQPQASIAAVSRRLLIPQAISVLMRGTYDCAFFLLGDQYLSSLSLPFDVDPSFPCLFLASPNDETIPRQHPYALIPAGKDEGSTFHYNLVGLKGHLFRLFAEQIVSPWTKTQVFQSCATADARLQRFLNAPTPQFFLSSIRPEEPHRAVLKEQVVQQSLFPDVCIKASETKAKNYGKNIRYFIPDWDDVVDPGYDFEHDQPTQQRKQYAHEIYGRPNYDGLLFSKSTVELGRTKVERIQAMGGIHAFARFEGKPILGDCGAFNYITEKEPPYRTKEILDYYERYGFTYGVSIDHLIVPAVYQEKEYRYQLTRENAREFIKLHQAGNYSFVPIGVVQGWSPQTYRDAVVELLECGYTYIALGGIARTQTRDIYEILEAVAPVLQAETDLHLFGIARDKDGDEMQRFRDLGVTSFDSASFLRRAWLGDKVNYLTEDGEGYTAIRVSPITDRSPRVKKIMEAGQVTFEQLQELERNALKALREYDRGMLDLETALAILLAIDQVEGDTQHEQAYRRTLEDQPWKRCPCAVCRDLGIEVLIFRGNDRNRRRGFHNTFTFYRRFQKLMEKGL